jgi:hypothetical protein
MPSCSPPSQWQTLSQQRWPLGGAGVGVGRCSSFSQLRLQPATSIFLYFQKRGAKSIVVVTASEQSDLQPTSIGGLEPTRKNVPANSRYSLPQLAKECTPSKSWISRRLGTPCEAEVVDWRRKRGQGQSQSVGRPGSCTPRSAYSLPVGPLWLAHLADLSLRVIQLEGRRADDEESEVREHACMRPSSAACQRALPAAQRPPVRLHPSAVCMHPPCLQLRALSLTSVMYSPVASKLARLSALSSSNRSSSASMRLMYQRGAPKPATTPCIAMEGRGRGFRYGELAVDRGSQLLSQQPRAASDSPAQRQRGRSECLCR